MARFNFVYGNHGVSPAHIEDIVTYVVAALTELGVIVDVSHSIDANSINILLECFDDNTPNFVASLARNGAQFIILATEYITNNTFNDFSFSNTNLKYTMKEQWGHTNREHWDWRFRNFMATAEHCKAIWVAPYEEFENYKNLLGSKVLSLPFAFVEGFAKVKHLGDKQKNIDFLFTGSVSERRHRVLSQFSDRGYIVQTTPPSTPSFIRENIIGRSKVCLGISQSDDWIHSSAGRTHYHLMNKSFIAIEKLPHETEMDQYSTVLTRDEYVEKCIDILESQKYTATAQINYERFREERSAKPLFLDILAKSL